MDLHAIRRWPDSLAVIGNSPAMLVNEYGLDETVASP
jgi:hypothetical protein